MPQQRLICLDGWRGIAILSVIAAHYGTSRGLNLGRFGVELFFVLSGRLMAEILFVESMPIGQFFFRRFSRVYPGLLVLATGCLAISSLTGLIEIDVRDWFTVLTFTHNYAAITIDQAPALDHIWSLCIEEHIYVLLGIIAVLHRNRPLPVAAITLGLALFGMANGAVQTLLGGGYYEVYWRTDVRGASILVAVAVFLFTRGSRSALLGSPLTPVVLGIAGLVLNANIVPDPIKYSLGTTCLALSVTLIGNATGWVMRILTHPATVQAGLWSYSLYLWQQPFFKMADSHAGRLALLPIAIACGIVSFYLVERPARQTLNRLASAYAKAGKTVQRRSEA